MKRPVLALGLLAWFGASLLAQGLDPAVIGQAPTTAWPTYHGDYTGRRFSPLSEINASNVESLALAWVYRATNHGNTGFADLVKSTPLEVNGVLYFTMPDNVWALDARTGKEVWHYRYPANDGLHIGSRGVGMWGHWLYFETPDCNLVSLDARSGKERWKVPIADVKLQYFCTMSPVVVRDHVVVGVGGDSLDNRGYLESRDPETGQVQWRWYVEPDPGQPGSETWPNKEALLHGGGMTWMAGTYDPELNLLFWGTGNPNPVHNGDSRQGNNLFTESIVALNADSGKLAWHFQSSPHDTHDWDAVQTPVLFDGEVGGRKRKLLAQASRNGYFFLLDRATGKNLVSRPYVDVNWSKGVDAKGQPIPDPKKEPARDGVLVTPSSIGATNWMSPTFNPQTGLFYVNASQNYSIYYRNNDEKPEGFAGRDSYLPAMEGAIRAIDYRTGEVKWSHDLGDFCWTGLMSTAGKLLFSGDHGGHVMALDPATGRTLWHVNVGAQVSNGPMTYELDGRQYVVFGAGDSLFAFALPPKSD